MQEERTKKTRGTTRHVTVDDRWAEVLVQDFPAFGVVEVREALEFEPVRMAMGILGWAAKKPDPARTLRGWARKRSRGYYRPRARRPDEGEEYSRYLAHLKHKDEEAIRERGVGLSRGEVDRLTRAWYAPGYRAAMGRIPEEAWEEIRRRIEEEEGAA